MLIPAENPPSAFGGYIPSLTVEYFIEKCREVYFCTDDYTEATFIVVNFGLYSVFVELSVVAKDAASREETQRYVQLCKDNLETALANLNILMPATIESIMALSLGVGFYGLGSTRYLLRKTGNSRHRNLQAIC